MRRTTIGLCRKTAVCDPYGNVYTESIRNE